jgi:hypothetical protein
MSRSDRDERDDRTDTRDGIELKNGDAVRLCGQADPALDGRWVVTGRGEVSESPATIRS